jgi:hypothetical protein
MSDFNTNQFAMSAKPGQIDLATTNSEALFTCRYNGEATSTDRLVEGEGVLLKDLGADDSVGPPIVDKLADDNEPLIFGIKAFTTKENNNAPGDIVQIARDGAVMFMKASGGITRGAKMALVNGTPGTVIIATTEDEVGIALDKAADTELLRVLIKIVAVST